METRNICHPERSRGIPWASRKLAGFTLVELIVVITILVILGTIAFISLGGFAGSARDSSRVSDLSLLSKGLDIYYARQGSYPSPSSASWVTYSGAVAWYQGVAGEGVILSLGGMGSKISKKPIDPLLNSEYGYSLASETREYSLKADYEGDSVSFQDISNMERAIASTGNPSLTYIKGTYNWVIAKVSTWGLVNLLAVPNIFLASGTILSNTSSGSFLVHGQSNSGGVSFLPTLVYSSWALPSSDDEKMAFASGVVSAYSGTNLAGNGNVAQFISASSSTGALASVGGSFIGTRLGGSASAVVISTTIVNATCWQNATTYAAGSWAFLGATANDFCITSNSTLSGVLATLNGQFPAQGSSTPWVCNSTGGGSPMSCTATRSLPGAPSAPTAGTHTATSNGITWNWNATSGATGYKYSTTNNYATATDNGSSTSYPQTGLSSSTAYTLYVWAYNAGGNSSVAILSKTTAPLTTGEVTYPSCTAAGQTYTAGSKYSDAVAGNCSSFDKVVCTRNWFGQIWAMCNAGTATMGTSGAANGSYYQWGNNADQTSTPRSGTAPTNCWSANDSSYSNATFINNWDPIWCSTRNDNLWGTITDNPVGTNYAARKGPCGTGYHVPTAAQWTLALNSITNNAWDATIYANVLSTLQLPTRWRLYPTTGNLADPTITQYWTSTLSSDGTYAETAYFNSSQRISTYNALSNGIVVRCIKD